MQDKAAEDGIREVDIELSKEVLGRGAFGVVRKATLKKDGKKVEVNFALLQRSESLNASALTEATYICWALIALHKIVGKK